MKKKSEKPGVWWVELSVFPCRIGFTTQKERFDREIKKMRIKDEVEFMRPGSNATTHSFESEDAYSTSIVCMKKATGRKKIVVIGLLAHEAMHCIQRMRIRLGMNDELEAEAYLMQTVLMDFIHAYNKGL